MTKENIMKNELNFFNELLTHKTLVEKYFRIESIPNAAQARDNFSRFEEELPLMAGFHENEYGDKRYEYIVKNIFWLFESVGNICYGVLFDKYIVGIDTSNHIHIGYFLLHNYPFYNTHNFQNEVMTEEEYLKNVESWGEDKIFVTLYPEYKKLCEKYDLVINFNNTDEDDLSPKDFEQRIEKAIGIKTPLNFSD